MSYGGFKLEKPEQDFIDGAEAVGYPEYTDLQDLESNNGTQRWLRYVSTDGQRQDAAHTFVHALIQDGKHPNLHVLCESKINRVIFDDNKRAIGVEYTPNPDYQVEINLTKHPKAVVKARKLVVVSCGACGTPSVLERSGVGNPEILKKFDIPVVSDLPGVGSDYQDHNLVFYPYRTNLAPDETSDAFFSGRIPRDEALKNKMPMLKWNTCDVSAKVRPTDQEVKELGPEFKAAWDRDFAHEPNRPLMLMSMVSSYLGDQSLIDPGQYMSVAAFTAYPYSRGSIHIRGPNWWDGSDFSLGFFTDPHDIDLKKQIWAYKKHREIMRRTNMYMGEFEIGHPEFPKGSKAACVNLFEDPSGNNKGKGKSASMSMEDRNNIKNVEYTKEDDEAIEDFLRKNIQTTWHSLGTCKMAPREAGGVVDGSLNVYGTTNLKVCDLSIPPENVAANTMNTALLVGEKGADIFLKELGYPPADNALFHHTDGIGNV